MDTGYHHSQRVEETGQTLQLTYACGRDAARELVRQRMSLLIDVQHQALGVVPGPALNELLISNSHDGIISYDSAAQVSRRPADRLRSRQAPECS